MSGGIEAESGGRQPQRKYRKTAYPGIGYTAVWPGDWRFVSLDTKTPFGRSYPSEQALLSAVEQQAAFRGWTRNDTREG